MSTHDYVLSNQSGSSFRTDLNNALAAIVTGNSSGTEPSTTYAYMEWNDTSNGVKKIRNAANNAWIELFQLDGTLTMEDGAEATPGLAFRDDLNTGIWSSGADTLDISTGGTKRITINSSGLGVGCIPNRELHVKGLDGTIRLESTAATGRTWIEFFDTSAIKGSIGYPSSGNNNLAIQQSENANLYFTTNDITRLTIDSDGDIEATGNLKSNNLSGRNILHNSEMKVAQRATSKTGIGSSNGVFYSTVDRWYTYCNNTQVVLTESQDSNGPDGFANSMKFACTTADTSIATNALVLVGQHIEGQDLQLIKKGTSAAEKLYLSFYVKGNASATYMAVLVDNDNSRMSSTQFAVTSSWNQIKIAIPSDTTGAFDDDNASSLTLIIYLHAGTNYTSGSYTAGTWQANTDANRAVGISSIGDSTSRTFQFTGVQLEIGSIATEFEHKSYAEELALCQRYYELNSSTWAGYCAAAQGNGSARVHYATTKRAAPTLTVITAATSVQNLTSQNLQGATVDGFTVDTRIGSSGYGRYYSLLAASEAEL
jgi:hypothetical protein